MDLLRGSVLDLADRRMRWLDRRQQVLAQNIANADTPGWTARDLRPFAAAMADSTGVIAARTQPMHQAGPHDPMLQATALTPVVARGPNGNTVSMEEQLMNVADTESAQSTAVNIFRKYMGLFRLALGRTS